MSKIGILTRAAACALVALPALAYAQEAVPPEPIPLFKAVCLDGSARLSRKVASPASYAMLPEPARRALGASTVTSRAEAEKLPAPAAAEVPNTIYRIGPGQLYLVVPGAPAPGSVIADSCAVLWYSLSGEDYAGARKVLNPGETAIPIIERPTASPVGAAVTTAVNGEARLTAAAYSGWVALRSIAANPDPQTPGAQ